MLRVDDNTRDSIEVYTIIQDDMVWNLTGWSILSRLNPAVMTVAASSKHHLPVSVKLAHLGIHLDLEEGTLAARCALDKPSATAVRLLLSPAQPVKDPKRVSFRGQTNIGIITLLFNVAGGLQV
jgi:hypothetical protein